jgi:hypothetical protein
MGRRSPPARIDSACGPATDPRGGVRDACSQLGSRPGARTASGLNASAFPSNGGSRGRRHRLYSGTATAHAREASDLAFHEAVSSSSAGPRVARPSPPRFHVERSPARPDHTLWRRRLPGRTGSTDATQLLSRSRPHDDARRIARASGARRDGIRSRRPRPRMCQGFTTQLGGAGRDSLTRRAMDLLRYHLRPPGPEVGFSEEHPCSSTISTLRLGGPEGAFARHEPAFSVTSSVRST